MKKMLLLLIVVGVLVFGSYYVAEEMSENISLEDMIVSEESPGESWDEVIPCGGSGGGGGGGVPG